MAKPRESDEDIIRRLATLPRTAGLTTREASIYSGLSESTLEKARSVGKGRPSSAPAPGPSDTG